MDPQLVMSMFKELKEEQGRIAEKHKKDMLDMVLRQVKGADMLSTAGEAMAVPIAMSALSNRLDSFVYVDPDVDSCFSKWYASRRVVAEGRRVRRDLELQPPPANFLTSSRRRFAVNLLY
ncbi:unnamed protein product [Heligmosomoides polygyrus]|uniref:1-phosphatidylinositol-3-phosphate 5-kinase n=1 Tax=Heligmosomoides polygyrus TaxID=6339 RepID=A0A183FY58_HELPZ|nr:unnamed protein product [Heligmosomoides polygyrus]